MLILRRVGACTHVFLDFLPILDCLKLLKTRGCKHPPYKIIYCINSLFKHSLIKSSLRFCVYKGVRLLCSQKQCYIDAFPTNRKANHMKHKIMNWVAAPLLAAMLAMPAYADSVATSKQSDAEIQTVFDVIYPQGQGVQQDYTKARALLEQAAAQGDAAAYNNLGMMYAQGQGVPQDYAKARALFEASGERGKDNLDYMNRNNLR